eukprot:g47240.t1
MMEVVLDVKMMFNLRKDSVVVTVTDPVMDKYICSQQIREQEVKVHVNVEDSQDNSLLTVYHYATMPAGSILQVGQDTSRNDDGDVWDIVRDIISGASDEAMLFYSASTLLSCGL